jgi:single-strand DNA-binding protein
MSLNKTMLIGHLGADPVDKEHYCYFHLATTYKSSDGKSFTSWHSIFCRDKLKDNVMKYLKKGDQCYVEGRLNYQKNPDGKTQSASITANEIKFLNKKEEGKEKVIEPEYNHQREVQETLKNIQTQQKQSNPLFQTKPNEAFVFDSADDIPF